MEGEYDSDIVYYDHSEHVPIKELIISPTHTSSKGLKTLPKENLNQPLLIAEPYDIDLCDISTGPLLLHKNIKWINRRRLLRYNDRKTAFNLKRLSGFTDISLIPLSLSLPQQTIAETPQNPRGNVSLSDSHEFLSNCSSHFNNPAIVKDCLHSLNENTDLFPSDLVSAMSFNKIRESVVSFSNVLSDKYAAFGSLNIYQKKLLAELVKRLNKFFLHNSRRYEPALCFVRDIWPLWVYLFQIPDKVICDAVCLNLNTITKFYTVNVAKRINEYLNSMKNQVEPAPSEGNEKIGSNVDKKPSVSSFVETLPTQALLRRFCDIAFKSQSLQVAASKLVCQLLTLCDELSTYYSDLQFFISGSLTFDGLRALPLTIESLKLAKLTGSKVFLVQAQRVYRKYGETLDEAATLDEITVALHEYYLTVIRSIDVNFNKDEGTFDNHSARLPAYFADGATPQEKQKETIADMFYRKGKEVDKAVLSAINILKARAKDDDPQEFNQDDCSSEDDEAVAALELAKLMAAPPTESSEDSGSNTDDIDNVKSVSSISEEQHGCITSANEDSSELPPPSLYTIEQLMENKNAQIEDLATATAIFDSKCEKLKETDYNVPLVSPSKASDFKQRLTQFFGTESNYDIVDMKKAGDEVVSEWIRYTFLINSSTDSLTDKMLKMRIFITSVSGSILRSKTASDQPSISLTEDEEDLLSQALENLTTHFLLLNESEKNEQKLKLDMLSNFLSIFLSSMGLGFVGEFESINFDRFLHILSKLDICSDVFCSIHKYTKSMSLLQCEDIRESLIDSDRKVLIFILEKFKALDDVMYLNAENPMSFYDSHSTQASSSNLRQQNVDLMSNTIRSLRSIIEKECKMTICEFISSCLIEHGCLNCVLMDLILRHQRDFSSFLTENPDILLQVLHICHKALWIEPHASGTTIMEQVDILAHNRVSYFLLLFFTLSTVDADTIVHSMKPLLPSPVEGDVSVDQQSVTSNDPYDKNSLTLDNIVFLIHTYLYYISKYSQQYSTDRSITYALNIINKKSAGSNKIMRIPFDLFRNQLDGSLYFVDGTNVAKLLIILTDACYAGLLEKSYMLISKLKIRSDAGGIARRLLTTGHTSLASMRTLNMDLYDRIRLMTTREKVEGLCYVDKAIQRLLLASLFLDRVAKARIPVSGAALESILMTLEYLVHAKLLKHISDPPNGDKILSSDLFWYPSGVKTKLVNFIVSLFTLSKNPITMTCSYALFSQLELTITDLASFYSSLEKLPNFRYINLSPEEISHALTVQDDPEAQDIVDPHTAEQAPLSLLTPPGPATLQDIGTQPATVSISEPLMDSPDQASSRLSTDRLSVSFATQSTYAFQYQEQLSFEEYTPLAQLFHRSFTHLIVAILFGLGNWRCNQLGQFLCLPSEKLTQLHPRSLSIPDKLSLLNCLSIILGEIDAITAFIPLIQQTLPVITILSGCLAYFDETIFIGNEPIIRTLLRVLLPSEMYFLIMRPVSGLPSQQHSLASSLTTKLASTGGMSLAPRPLSSSFTNKPGYYTNKLVTQSNELPASLKTKQTVLSCLRSTIATTIQTYASPAGQRIYSFYDIYTNELIHFSQLEICSIYLIGWLRLTQTPTFCYDTTLTTQLLLILSYFSQLNYSIQTRVSADTTEPTGTMSFNAFASINSATTPLMVTNSPAIRPSSTLSTTRGLNSGPLPAVSRSVPGLFAPNFNTVSYPFISLLFPAFTFDGAVSNFFGWVIYHFLLGCVRTGALEGLLHKAHVSAEFTSIVVSATQSDRLSSSKEYIDSLTELFTSQMDTILACKNMCTIVSALTSILQYDLVQLPEASMKYENSLPAHVLQSMIMSLPDTVCKTGDLSFDEPGSGSKMTRILVPASAPIGTFSTIGCFAIDPPQPAPPQSPDTDKEGKSPSSPVFIKSEDTEEHASTPELALVSKMVDIYIAPHDASIETHFSYLSSTSTLADVWQSYQVFLSSEHNDYFYLRSHAIVDPACIHSIHLGMFFALCSYNIWIRMLLDPLFRKSVLVQRIDDQTDPYYALYRELQHAYKCYCFETTHLSALWFGADLIAITRILRSSSAPIDDADIAQRKHLCLLKRACIYMSGLKDAFRLSLTSDEAYNFLIKQREAIEAITDYSILSANSPSTTITNDVLLCVLMSDLAIKSATEYSAMTFLGTLNDIYTNGGGSFLLCFHDKLFIFRHLMRLGSNCYMSEQTLDETMVEATKYVPIKNTTLEITVRRDSPLQSLIEYLDQNVAGSQAALQKPWRVAFLDENALDLHGPRQEYMNLVTQDLMGRCQAFSHKSYLPRVPRTKTQKRQSSYLEYVLLSYLISRSITEFLSLSFDVPITLLRRVLGISFHAIDIMYSSPELYYGNIITLLNVDKVRFEDYVGLDVSDVPFDDTLDSESTTIKCSGDTMQDVNMIVSDITGRRAVPINIVAKLLQRSLPNINLRIFTPPELRLVISGISKLSADQLLSLFKWVHPSTDVCSSAVSKATEEAFAKVIRGMSEEDIAKFLCFVTGSSRVPPNGFEPELKIQRLAAEGETIDTKPEDIDPTKLRLPSASTCFHSLKLPPYCEVSNLQIKLSISMNEGKTFEFA